MSKTSCAAEAKGAFGFLDEKEANELENAIAELIEGNPETDVGLMRKEILDIVKQESERMKEQGMIKLGDSIKVKRANSASRGAAKDIDTSSVAGVKKYIKTRTKFLLDMIEGKNSIDTTSRTESKLLKGHHYGSLSRAGVLDHYKSGKYDSLVQEEMFRRGNKEELGYKSIAEDIPEGFSKEQAEIAMKIADVAKKTTDLMLNNQRSVGLPIRNRRDWLYKHSYSKTKMTAMGEQGFIALVRKHGAEDRMFNNHVVGNKAKEDAALIKVYHQILEAKDMYRGSEPISGFMASLKSRQLEFKSGIDEHAFYKEISDHTGLVENMDVAMDQAASAYATVKHLGVRSGENFQKVMNDVESDIRNITKGKFSDQETNKLIGKLRQELKTIDDAYVVTSANPYSPKGRVTNTVNVLRGLNSMTKLGSSLFTSMYDGITISLQYSLATGENQFMAFGKTFIDSMSMLKEFKNRNEFAEMLNTASYLSDPALAMGGNKGDFKTGMDRWNRFTSSLYKWTGVPFQTEISRNVGGLLQARAIRKFVNDFKAGKMNKFQKVKMERYGITEQDIDILNTIKSEEGLPDIIAPQHIMELDLKKFHENEVIAHKMKRELFDKFGNWVDDAVQAGTPTPTSRIKRILLKGENIDNEMTRGAFNLMMQFKETAAKIVDENIQAYQDYGRAAGGMGQAQGLGLYALNGMMTYMLIENAKSYLLGTKSPMERYKEKGGGKKLFMDYVNRSSFLPVLTDIGGAAPDKYWRSAVPNMLLGPTFAMGMDTMQALHNPNRKNIGRAAKHVTPLLPTYAPWKMLQRQLLHNDLFTGQKIRK